MKILRKPKILPCECRVCGTVFLPKWKDLTTSSRIVKDSVRCPMCIALNDVHFEKGGERDGDL